MRTVAKIALPLGAACLLLAAVPAQAETKILFNYFVPPKHPLKVGIMDNWSKRVTEGSNGRIEVSYPAKTLAPAPRQWKMITSGIADATVMIAPPMRPATWSEISVTTGISALRSACLRITRRRDRPLALAVRR